MRPLRSARLVTSQRFDDATSHRFSSLGLALVAAITLLAPVSANAACSGDVYDEFAPMLGNWDLQADEKTVGSVEVRADQAGCSLHRTFRIGDQIAESILFVDPASGQLNELVIDQDGGLYRLAGTRQNGSWNLAGTFTDNAGNGTGARVSIEALPEGGFRETLDLQSGSAWNRVFDFRFGGTGASGSTVTTPPTRVTSTRATAGAEPAAPAPPSSEPTAAAPAAATAADQERIRVSSGAEGSSTMRGQAVSKIVVDSPMLVDLQLGPIDKLPDGYAWSSKDLARYEIDGATIENVEVRRRTRRGKSTLLVTLFGTSPKFTDEFDVSIEVLDADGNSLSDVAEGRLYVGRSISQQISDGTNSLKMELRTQTEALNAALGSENRPKLAIKVVERD